MDTDEYLISLVENAVKCPWEPVPHRELCTMEKGIEMAFGWIREQHIFSGRRRWNRSPSND